MKKYFGPVLSLVMGAAAALESGCALPDQKCSAKGGEVSAESYLQLNNECAKNRNLVFKCIIVPAGVSDSGYVNQYQCSSPSLAQDSKNLIGDDFVHCAGSTNPEKVSAVCD